MKGRSKELILGALLVAIVFALWHNLGGDSETAVRGGPRSGPMVRVNPGDLKLPEVDWAALQAPIHSHEERLNFLTRIRHALRRSTQKSTNWRDSDRYSMLPLVPCTPMYTPKSGT